MRLVIAWAERLPPALVPRWENVGRVSGFVWLGAKMVVSRSVRGSAWVDNGTINFCGIR